MPIPWQSIQGFSGATAVGTLTLLGLLLTANAFATNLFPAIHFYSQTPTWAIVVAVPVVALSYLLGLLSNGAAEAVLVWLRLVDGKALTEDPVWVSVHGEFVAGRFQQLRQEAELLAGSAISMTLLSIGAGLSAWNVEGWRRFLTTVALVAIGFALSSIALSRSRFSSAHRLAVAAASQEMSR
jgi:hypothetical protein